MNHLQASRISERSADPAPIELSSRLIGAGQGPSTLVESPLQISYFLCKTNPILSAVGGLQTQYAQRIMKINGSGTSEKTNPIQTQTNPIAEKPK